MHTAKLAPKAGSWQIDRLRGGPNGDMFIELAVETPVNLTARQKELLREFDGLSENNNPESRSFLSSVKNFWDSMKS